MAKLTFRYYPQPVSPESIELEKRIFKYSLIVPVIFLVIIWLIKLSETILDIHLYDLGVLPRNISGLKGIITSPLIHADFKHLIANSTSFFVLSTALFFFYRKVALRIFLLNYLMSGILLWLGGREVLHIGASGIIYGMASFLLFTGIFRQDLRLLTISLIVIFLYGSFIWGLFPIEPQISWDGHLMGAVSGTILSLIYYKQGPPLHPFEMEKDLDEEEENDEEYWNEEFDDHDKEEKKEPSPLDH
jgi:membrane associated rhomboid family serine protease